MKFHFSYVSLDSCSCNLPVRFVAVTEKQVESPHDGALWKCASSRAHSSVAVALGPHPAPAQINPSFRQKQPRAQEFVTSVSEGMADSLLPSPARPSALNAFHHFLKPTLSRHLIFISLCRTIILNLYSEELILLECSSLRHVSPPGCCGLLLSAFLFAPFEGFIWAM